MSIIDEQLTDFILKHQLSKEYIQTADLHFTQLVNQIHTLKKAQPQSVVFIGINGCQGSGKSTLADYLVTRLSTDHQYQAITLSLDDFYLSSAKRQQLAHAVHPLLKTRGVPGTHDTEQLQETLAALATKHSNIAIPRFDKATDNPLAKSEWPVLTSPMDIVILEGWCWGIPPQDLGKLQQPINELECQFDPQSIWREYVNAALKRDYLPLYQYMHYWIMLQAPSFNCVYRWRLEQEHKLRKSTTNSAKNNIMTDQEIAHFIEYFQRLTEHGLAVLPKEVDIVFQLDQTRKIASSLQKQ
ncbi:kinase [Colwelliaceae bacterium 6471]